MHFQSKLINYYKLIDQIYLDVQFIWHFKYSNCSYSAFHVLGAPFNTSILKDIKPEYNLLFLNIRTSLGKWQFLYVCMNCLKFRFAIYHLLRDFLFEKILRNSCIFVILLLYTVGDINGVIIILLVKYKGSSGEVG